MSFAAALLGRATPAVAVLASAVPPLLARAVAAATAPLLPELLAVR